jgi:hypothetical protein
VDAFCVMKLVPNLLFVVLDRLSNRGKRLAKPKKTEKDLLPDKSSTKLHFSQLVKPQSQLTKEKT